MTYVIHCPGCNKVVRKIDDPKDGDKYLEYCDVCKIDFVVVIKLTMDYFVQKLKIEK